MDNEALGINFQNDVPYTEEFNTYTYRNFYNGGGVAIGDLNNDGLADIYFTGNIQGNKLYLNKGNWKFKDITTSAGVATSAESQLSLDEIWSFQKKNANGSNVHTPAGCTYQEIYNHILRNNTRTQYYQSLDAKFFNLCDGE